MISLPSSQTASLASLCAEARDLLVAQWPDAAIRMGVAYAEEDTAGDRIVFLPAVDSSAGPPSEIGGQSVASITQGLLVLVWAADDEAGYGFGQYDRAEQLRNDVIITMRSLVRYSEHTELVMVSLDQTPGSVSYGEQYRVSFTYKYDVDVTESLTGAPDNVVTAAVTTERI